MQFKIRMINQDEQLEDVFLSALDEHDLRAQLKALNLFPVVIESLDGGRQRSAISKIPGQGFFNRKNKSFSILLFAQELRALLNAGLSLLESLEALAEKETNAIALDVLMHLSNALKEGKRFSQALAEREDVFPVLFVGIVQSAERTSSLSKSLEQYSVYQQRIELIRSKLVSALIYPSILFLVGGAVTLFLVTYVVPRFSEVYRGTGRQLPWMSQMLLEWGSLINQYRSTVLIGVTLVLASLIFIVRESWHNGRLLSMFNRIPRVGEYLRIYTLSRIYLTLGMLLNGGIPIVNALATVKATVKHEFQESLTKALICVESGGELSQAFLDNNLTTSISYRMLRVGERTGDLGEMLNQSAQFYESELNRWIDHFIRSFEPVLMAVIGIIVGGVVVLLYMPIFDLADGLS